jgi:hypothetical protein
VNTSEATLHAEVNPGGAETSFRFQYVAQSQFEEDGYAKATLTPEKALAKVDNAFHDATAAISGLKPDTSYRFRVLVNNAEGSVEGEDRILHTYALPNEEPDSCPNAALRAAQHSTYLSDCRAYEMVSPPQKNGGEVMGDSARTRAALDCASDCAVQFASLTGFGDVHGTGIATDYIAERGDSAEPGDNGWATHAITPPQKSMSLFAGFQGFDPRYQGEFSDDLSKGVFQAWSPLTDEPNVANVQNLYLRSDLRIPGPGTYELVSDSATAQPSPQVTKVGESVPRFAGASADFSRIAFESPLNLAPGAEGSQTKAYLWDQGEVSLAGVLPNNGDPALCADSGEICSIVGQSAFKYSQIRRAISRDGNRIVFTAPSSNSLGSPGGILYQRVDGTETIHLNASERTDCAGDPSCGGDNVPDPAPDPAGARAAEFQWASADGTRVFFTTAEQLTDDDDSGATDLYLYDAMASGGHLTLISTDEYTLDGHGGNQGVIGASDDGDYVYFIHSNLLVNGAPPLPDSGRAIYLWHEGNLRFAVPLPGSAGIPLNTPESSAFAGARYEARVTPNGRRLLFTSKSGEGILSMRGGTDYQHTEQRQKYVYDADTDELRCASCNPSGAPATGDATAAARAGAGNAATSNHVNRSLSDDGRYVFFETTAALLPERDTNGKEDAYVYDTQTEELHLLSSGTSPFSSYFMDASGDGKDAFILTRERLVGWDVDNAYDLYDVRVGGGFPEPLPTTAPCGGENCRTPGVNPPGAVPPATAGFSGPGDPTRPKPCPKGKRRVKARGGKSRCVKPKKSHRKHNRTAKNDRRASR